MSLPESASSSSSVKHLNRTRSTCLSTATDAKTGLDVAFTSTLGVSAARRLYDTPELRHLVLCLVEQRDLATLLRVEKEITTAVAEVLYRKVHVSQAKKMSRAIPRRAAYCDAVRYLDLNPPPIFTPLTAKVKPFAPGTPFDISTLATWRKKYPDLSTIDCSYPHEHDDAYTVQLHSDGSIILNLESRVTFNVLHAPFPTPGPPPLPPTPIHPGMMVHHTIAIHLIEEYSPEGHNWYATEIRESVGKWRRWLSTDPALDRRVVSIVTSPRRNPLVSFTFAEIALFHYRRSTDGSELPSSVTFPPTPGITPEIFLTTTLAFKIRMGAGIRTLTIPMSFLMVFESEPMFALNILDTTFPHLEHLIISDYIEDERNIADKLPLAGMPNLRLVSLKYVYMGVLSKKKKEQSLEAIARFIWGLGSEDCVYHVQHLGLKTAPAMQRFDEQVRERKRIPGTSDEHLGAEIIEQIRAKYENARRMMENFQMPQIAAAGEQ